MQNEQVYGNNHNDQSWPLSYSYAALAKVAVGEDQSARMCCSPYSQTSMASDQDGVQFSASSAAIMVNGVNIHDDEINCVDSLRT